MTKISCDGATHPNDAERFNAAVTLSRLHFGGDFGTTDSPLYAIPHALLEAIERRMAGWISPSEMEFEKGLTDLCGQHHGVGIVPGKVISCMLLPSEEPSALSREIFEKMGWDGAWTFQQARRLLATGRQRGVIVQDQLIAYAGWLMTEPAFVEDVEALKARNPASFDPTAADEELIKASEDFTRFRDRWQLAGMASWDLPLPQGPNLTGVPFPESVTAREQMSEIQLPATMRLPARFPLREMLGEMQRDSPLEHLAGWQQILDRQEHQRFERMLPLHFYRHIVLPSRYGDRIKRHVEGLDEAFGDYFGKVSGDSIKKLRLECKRRLRG